MCVSVSLRKPVTSVLPSFQERIPGAKNLDTEKKRFANFPPPQAEILSELTVIPQAHT